MSNENEVVIPLSKLKIVLLILGAAVFIALGIWLLSLDPEQIRSLPNVVNPKFVHEVAYVCIAFSGLCGLYGITKVFRSEPGLIISSKGITDNSSAVAAGLIPWPEIIGFSEYKVQNKKMLIVHVEEPNKYMDRGNLMKRALNKANMKMVGSPISISSTSLKIKHTQLLDLCTSSFKKYRKNA